MKHLNEFSFFRNKEKVQDTVKLEKYRDYKINDYIFINDNARNLYNIIVKIVNANSLILKMWKASNSRYQKA